VLTGRTEMHISVIKIHRYLLKLLNRNNNMKYVLYLMNNRKSQITYSI